MTPTTASETFVRDVNSLIEEVRIAYNRRRGAATDSGSSAEDRPLIE